MDRTLLPQRIAMGACAGMFVLLVLLQYVFTPDRQAPTFLFFIFSALWIFGFLMLTMFPMFGALGTAAWGLISAAGAARTHTGFAIEDILLIGGSLFASAAAAAYFMKLRQARGA